MSEPNETATTDGPSDEALVRRYGDRAAYDATSVHAVLDDGWVAHVASVRDGKPVVIPMYYVRDGDWLLLHGAPATGTIRRGAGVDVCVSVTHLDGFVLARSGLHHSMNYRSVVVHGTAEPVDEPEAKAAALERFVDRMVPGRQAMIRPNTAKEIQGTGVLRLALTNASVKYRAGGPVDDDDDYELPIWAGVVPITTVFGEPEGDGRSPDGVEVPAGVQALTT